MSSLVFFKLLAIFVIVAIGWIVGALRWLSPAPAAGSPATTREVDPARILSNAAYYIFVPALLFRTTARIDFATMPWGTLVAVFVPLVLMLLAVYLWQRRANRDGRLPIAAASVRAISASFGNTVQVGIPMAAALFGEAGLAIHLAIVSLHALVLLTLSTALVELDLARAQRRSGASETHLSATLLLTARNTNVHPVVLPALVLAIAHWGFRLNGLPLAVVVMMAALPVGSNALIFAQRYRTLEAETTTATVFSTLAFVLTAPLWLALLQALA